MTDSVVSQLSVSSKASYSSQIIETPVENELDTPIRSGGPHCLQPLHPLLDGLPNHIAYPIARFVTAHRTRHQSERGTGIESTVGNPESPLFPPLSSRIEFMFEGIAYKLGDWVVLKSDGPRDWVACIVEYIPPADVSEMNTLLGVESEGLSEGSILCQWAWHVEELKEYVIPDLDTSLYSRYEIFPCLDTDMNPVEAIQRKVEVVHYSKFCKFEKPPQEFRSWPPEALFWRQIYLGEDEIYPQLENEVHFKPSINSTELAIVPKNPDWIYWLCKHCKKLYHPNAVKNVKESKYQRKRYPAKTDKLFVCMTCISSQTMRKESEPKTSQSQKRRKVRPTSSVTSYAEEQLNITKAETQNDTPSQNGHDSAVLRMNVLSNVQPTSHIQKVDTVRSCRSDEQKSTKRERRRAVSLIEHGKQQVMNITPQTLSSTASNNSLSFLPKPLLDPSIKGRLYTPGASNAPVDIPSKVSHNISENTSTESGEKPAIQPKNHRLRLTAEQPVNKAGDAESLQSAVNALQTREKPHAIMHVTTEEVTGQLSKNTPRPSGSLPHFVKLQSSFQKGFEEMQSSSQGHLIKYRSAEEISQLVFDAILKTFTDSKEKRQRFHEISENLKRENNPDLRRKILSGELEVSKLVTMDAYQLAPDAIQREREEQRNKYFEKQVKLTESAVPVTRKTHKGLEVLEKEDSFETLGNTELMTSRRFKRMIPSSESDEDSGDESSSESSEDEESDGASSNNSATSSSSATTNSTDSEVSHEELSEVEYVQNTIKKETGESGSSNVSEIHTEEKAVSVKQGESTDKLLTEGTTKKENDEMKNIKGKPSSSSSKLASPYQLPRRDRFRTAAVKARLIKLIENNTPAAVQDTLKVYLSIACDRIEELKVICGAHSR